jgi:hypothetical protein
MQLPQPIHCRSEILGPNHPWKIGKVEHVKQHVGLKGLRKIIFSRKGRGEKLTQLRAKAGRNS